MKCLNPNCKDPTFLENLGQLLGVQPDFCPSCGAPTTSSKDGTESEESKNAESSQSKQALSVQSCDSQSVTSNDGLAQIQDHQSAGPNDDEKHRSGVSDVNEDKNDSSSRSRETQQNNKTQVQYELQEPQSQTQLVVANEEVKTPGRQGTPLKEPESETISRDGWQSSQQERYQPGLQEQRQLAEQLQDGKEMQHEEKQQQQQQLQNEKENSKEKQKLVELEQQQKKKEKQQKQHQEEEGNEEEKQKLLERRQEKQQQEGEEENKKEKLSLQQHQEDKEAKKAEQKKKLPEEQQGNQLQQIDNEKEEDVTEEEEQQSQLQTDLNQEQQSEQQQNQQQLLKEQQNQVLEIEELQRKLQQQEQTEIEHPQQPHQYEKQNQAKQELSLQQEQRQHNQEHQKTTTELQQQQMLLEIKHQELLVKNQTQEQIILQQQQQLLEQKLLLEQHQRSQYQQQSPNTSAPNILTSPQSTSNDDLRGPSPSSNVKRPPLGEGSNADPSQTIDASNDRSKATYAAVASNKNIENMQGVPETAITVVASLTTTPTVTTTKVIYMGGSTMDNLVKGDKDTNPSSQQNDNRNRVKGDASSNDKTGENQGELSEQEVLTFTEEGHVKAQLKPEHKQTGKEKRRNADKTGTTVGTQSASSTSHQMTTRSSSRSDYMTVVFHALLSPHFKFDQSKGDRVIIRGDVPLSGWKNDDLQMTIL